MLIHWNFDLNRWINCIDFEDRFYVFDGIDYALVMVIFLKKRRYFCEIFMNFLQNVECRRKWYHQYINLIKPSDGNSIQTYSNFPGQTCNQ